MGWNEKVSSERIKKAWTEFGSIVVKPLVKEVSFDNIPLDVAYAVDGVHVYVDIANASTLVGDDGDAAHKKMLRFLHVLMRVAHLVFQRTDAVKVDLQNTRLHFVVYKPYDDEAARVRAAVAIAKLLRSALAIGNVLHAELANTQIVIGIESGITLAVRNGTKGDREPLFLGNAANFAAKLTSSATMTGTYLGAQALKALVSPTKAGQPLPENEISDCERKAALAVTVDDVAKAWTAELKDNAIGDVTFTAWNPPLSDAAIDQLTYANSRRQVLVLLYADIDGFTKFVAAAIASGQAQTAVRLLHVIRKELRDVLNDFRGKKVRYIGDCVQGLILEGTARETDNEKSIVMAVACAAAMRSAFVQIQKEIPAARSLGIQIGLEIGPSAVSRVGVQGTRDRVVVGRATLVAEAEQARCTGSETAIGPRAYAEAPVGVRNAFGPGRKADDIDYDRFVAHIENVDAPAAAPFRAPVVGPAIVVPRAHCR